MQIQLLYAPGCGGRNRASEALSQAVRELGLRAYVEEIRVSTEEEAAKYGMVGSPTVLVNGRDIARGGPPSLECRTHERVKGGQQGWPDLELVKWALEASETPLACCG